MTNDNFANIIDMNILKYGVEKLYCSYHNPQCTGCFDFQRTAFQAILYCISFLNYFGAENVFRFLYDCFK